MIIDRLELIIIRRLLLRVEKGMEICVVIKQMCRNNLELARFISVVSERRSRTKSISAITLVSDWTQGAQKRKASENELTRGLLD